MTPAPKQPPPWGSKLQPLEGRTLGKDQAFAWSLHAAPRASTCKRGCSRHCLSLILFLGWKSNRILRNSQFSGTAPSRVFHLLGYQYPLQIGTKSELHLPRDVIDHPAVPAATLSTLRSAERNLQAPWGTLHRWGKQLGHSPMVSSKPQDRCVLPQLGHGLLPTCSSWGLCTRAASPAAGAPSTQVPSSSLGLKAEQANPWHIATDWGCAGNPLPAPRGEQLPASARGRSKTSWQQPRSHSAPSPGALAAPSPAEQELGNLSPGPLRHANPPDLLLNQMLNLLQSTCAMWAFRGAGEAAGGKHGAAPRGCFSLLVGRCCSQGLSSAPCSRRFAPGAAGMEKGERKCSCCPDATPQGEYFHLQTLALGSAGMFRAQTPRHGEKCAAGGVSAGRYLHRQHPQHPAASQPCFPSLSQHPDPPQLVAAGLGVASCIAFPLCPGALNASVRHRLPRTGSIITHEGAAPFPRPGLESWVRFLASEDAFKC